MSFDPSAPAHHAFVGYTDVPIPSDLDRLIEMGAPILLGESPPPSTISRSGRDVLLAYAERMASLAVRRQDRALLVRATVAIALGGLLEGSRDAVMSLALVDDAAARIETPLDGVFKEAEALVGHPSGPAFLQWLIRAPQDRTIEAMGYTTVERTGQFRYQFTG